MPTPDPWPFIHTERKALAADLTALSEDQWKSPSLCEGWTTQDVLAHMTAAAKITPTKFFSSFLGSGFSFEGVQKKGIAAERGATGADTLEHFNAVLDSNRKPPGPIETPLGEVVLHSEDIRRPLDIDHHFDAQWLTRLADFYRGSNLIIGGKKRASGLSFRATDTDWTAGSGPEVAGPALSIVMAITGRKAALGDLSGDGVDVISRRM
jgi:uncharacterized protein (TIGR03083 family)